MRLTLKLLIKCFIVVILIMFMLPLLMNQLDSQERRKATDKVKVSETTAFSFVFYWVNDGTKLTAGYIVQFYSLVQLLGQF